MVSKVRIKSSLIINNTTVEALFALKAKNITNSSNPVIFNTPFIIAAG
jgi:hypothetical protein